jgi:hypothetical protein
MNLEYSSYSSHYEIGYAVVSLIFVTNAVGFILAAFFVDALRARFGRGSYIKQNMLPICNELALSCDFDQSTGNIC